MQGEKTAIGRPLARGAGILCHLTSLPSDFGIGDLGPQAHRFIDLLAASGQRYWQFLPLGPVAGAFAMSPYMGLSAFAGNPLLISPEGLCDAGLVDQRALAAARGGDQYLVDYAWVRRSKEQLLAQAWANSGGWRRSDAYLAFCRDHAWWLEDYALYMVLRRRFPGRSWTDWPVEYRHRHPRALAELRRLESEALEYHRFVQHLFFHQWQALRDHARSRGILLVGDLPIYVGHDSAEVWARPHCFRLDPASGRPTHVAGVPPDYFSATGQLWGNPLYRWQEAGEELLAWWGRRFRHNFLLADLVRVDHFRGFASYWEIPADAATAVHGRWVPGPGLAFFQAMARQLGPMAIIAEDLGTITEDVLQLRDRCGFPGMKVLQFAFDGGPENAYLPHNYDNPQCVVYTGTHDNDTTVGWYLDPKVPAASKAAARRYAHSDGSEIHWDFIRMALASVARVAIVPLQDVLGFGADCRMNVPGTREGNWRWRCAPRFLTDDLFNRLADETRFYHRLPPAAQRPAPSSTDE